MRRLEEQAKREAAEELQRRAEVEAERQRKGEKRRGREPKPVDETPADKAQMSFTDAELHIMPTNNKGWDYCGNAQASVDGARQIILACDVTDETNDKKQGEPMAQAMLPSLHLGPRLGRERCGKINAVNAASDSCTGIGVVSGFLAGAGMMQWPYLKSSEIVPEKRYLQI